MAIKKYGPTTPGRRGMTVTDYSVLSKVAPERSLERGNAPQRFVSGGLPESGYRTGLPGGNRFAQEEKCNVTIRFEY